MIGELLLRWLWRWLRRHRPPQGWGSVLWTLAGLAMLAGSLHEAAWLRNAPAWLPPLWLSALMAMWLAPRLRTAWSATLILTVTGLFLAVMTVAQAWPSWQMWMANARYVWDLISRRPVDSSALIALGPWWLGRVQWLATDVSAWLQGTAGSSAARGLALLFYALLWGAGSWAGWVVRRQGRALPALLPAGVLLAVNTFYAADARGWIWGLMAALALLSVRLTQFYREKGWRQQGIDFSPEYRLELYSASLFVTSALLVAMLLAPNVRVQPAVNAFWSLFDAPYLQIERRGERLLSGVDQPPRSLIGGGDVATGGLPRAHLLGDDPALSQRKIMRVQVDGPNTPDPTINYRWRALTFVTYNGQGWLNPPQTDVERFAAGEIWDPALAERQLLVQQRFEFLTGEPYWLYALAEPLTADRPYRVHTRIPGDVAGLDIRARRYTVISALPNVSEAALRAAPPVDQEEWAWALQLPEDLPPRLWDLAANLGQKQDTSYDQARTIESYLRGFRYNLQVPAPPPDRDVVDWFLFDLQEGYCDYYASSMVVLARMLGIPARLAIGYATGTYEADDDWFLVTEADAHSWPELYFAGVGWVPFEPTAAQEVYTWPQSPRPADLAGAESEVETTLAAWQRQAWWRYGLWRWPAAILMLGLLWMVGRRWRRMRRLRQQASSAWELVYWHLGRKAQQWGLAPHPGLTPYEMGHIWRQALAHESSSSLPGEVQQLIDGLLDGLNRRVYAPPAQRPSDAQAWRLWRRLQRLLWRLQWQRRIGGLQRRLRAAGHR